MSIFERLPQGEENAISSQELTKLCGYRSIRDLQAKVAVERAAGAPILSTCRHGGGYFRADDGEKGQQELENCRRTLTARAVHIFGALRPIHMGYELAKQYIADGDSDSAVELLRGMSKELTASGQFSQAAAISLMQNDPMTALRYAQRSIDDLNASGAKELGRQWKNFRLTDAEIKAFESIHAGDGEAISSAMESIGNRIAKELYYSERIMSIQRCF